MNAKSRRQVLVTWSVKSLRHDVRQHRRSLAIFELHFTALDLITNVVVLDVNVLGTTMVHRILRLLDTRLVVFKDDKLWSFICAIRSRELPVTSTSST